MGVLKMTREHLGITLGMNVPLFIVLTKIDLAPENVTKRTINDIISLFDRFKVYKKLGISSNAFILTEKTEKTIDFNHNVPAIPVSNVSGENVTFKKFY